MPDGKGGDEFRDVLKAGQEEHHAEQKQEMIVAGDHVNGAGPEEVGEAAVHEALGFGVWHAVSPSASCRNPHKKRG